MPLSNEKHIKIGTEFFVLDESVGAPGSLIRPHFLHNYASLLTDRVDVSGDPGVQNLRPEIGRWVYSDFSGGEGNLVYDPNDPIVYDFATVNTRNPGYFTSPPGTSGTTTIDAAIHPTQQYLCTSGGLLVWAGGTKVYTTPDALTWTLRTSNVPGGSTITGLIGASNTIFVHYTNAPASQGNVGIKMLQSLAAGTDFVPVTGGGTWDTTGKGLAFVGPYIFRWTGNKLFLYDSTDRSGAAAGTLVFSPGTDEYPSTRYGDICATDNSIVFFYAAPGSDAQVYEFVGGLNGVGSPIWGGTDLKGFTPRTMTFVAGKLYLAGTYNNLAFLWAMDMSTKQSAEIGFFREDQNTTLTPVASSPGQANEVLITMAEGYVFSYRADLDSISLIDAPGTHLAACASYLDKRVTSIYGTSNSSSQSWNTDRQTAQTSGTWTITMPVWDWQLPFESHKTLLGFKVQTDALSGSNTVKVEYQANEDGTWTQAGATLTSGTDNYLQVSDALTAQGGTGTVGSVTFGQLRYRVTITGNPKVYAISVYDYNANYGETIEYVVKLSPEGQEEGTQYEAWDMTTKIRFLQDLQTTRKLVTVVEGYEAGDPREAITYPVMAMEDLNIIIYSAPDSPAQAGIARFTMRNLETP